MLHQNMEQVELEKITHHTIHYTKKKRFASCLPRALTTQRPVLLDQRVLRSLFFPTCRANASATASFHSATPLVSARHRQQNGGLPRSSAMTGRRFDPARS